MIFQLYYSSSVQNFNDFEDYKTIQESLKELPFLYEDARFARDGGSDIVWKRPKEICRKPYFIKEQPSRFDVLQGNLGDCWALSAFQVLTLNDRLCKRVVPRQGFGENYVGAFHFRLFKLGFWYDVVIDDRLPFNTRTNSLEYAHSMNGDIFWGALLEKAFAKFCSENIYGYTYQSLIEGLIPTSFQAVTGGIAETMKIRGPAFFKNLLNIIHQTYSDGALIVATTYKGEKGLLPRHSYGVTELYEVKNYRSKYNGVHLVRLMNPWGHKEWSGEWSDDDYWRWVEINDKIREEMDFFKGDDGDFWMCEEDFLKYFKFISICHLSPRNYMERRHFQDNSWFQWYLTIVRGEWVKNVTMAGADKSLRHRNPQYVFRVGKLGGKKLDSCPTMIELTMWSKKARKEQMKIAFYVYDLSSKNQKPPFRQNFFLKNNALDEWPDFDSSYDRCYLQSFDLELGKRYLLIPCTLRPNFEAVFAFRIMSHYDIKVFDSYEHKISKSLPMETESPNKNDKKVLELFLKASQGKDEIDWMGLRNIFDDALGRSSDFISYLISYFLKFVMNTFIPTMSYDERNEGLFFTKDECRGMIAMLEDNHSGKLNFSEFSNLWNKISFWTKVYDKYKEEGCGCLPTSELRDALSAVGHDISYQTVHSFSYIYANEQSYIALKDFILCGVAMETVLPLCATKRNEEENIVFTLHEWIKNTLIL